ncbi:Ran guanine nucleotide release factor [Rhynchospora pubera]|uniref:Ran guanine nucleotide release factor n=1 Tax=Rhynchospora pubera TaxID=906938 RepID=A0AAV8FAA9_9POAL|nr:Ran guanine nucleotide release factor [Rhynchospora pubera]
MANDVCTERPLFGGAISCSFPARFQDVSSIREVPDHQEVFVDPSRDESLIIELLDLKNEVEDHESATWFLRDLAIEQDASDSVVVEHSGIMELSGLQYGNVPVPAMTAVGQLAVSKGRQGRGAENIVRVYLANIRLKNVSTDLLITAYEPLIINPLSESARTVGAGVAVPAEQSGCLPVQEVFRLAVSSFKIHDWNLFGGGAEA